ncbi:glycoside hydrolase family 5 protein [Xanthomonas hortorum pv. vitians]|uniref:glycoside hydrolase family 5 protein n=1 Tax=Xanthomonas hortorum TaxID=56454 RepID=UPI000BC09DCC|nr:glycoside hydrolase family 5 protein [Xanthomonas hortorum]ASW44949.1 beta-mannosidase [Xanthomonas hortorum]MCE4309007.1 glycoside hydrolase family 5 protein [Xanthomonas hortorum pv. vitians]MCE4338440.1 glycoside hydrolase family 5 protein [Xanthomonas hortorum pv. vitians]MCE4509193.1 glycoside hydrolase family 5 protein [Xanthomonas hortorum pv. vitians]MDT7820246.1 glycoside hydrolase family 5 protein [Xanthomonas hortorum pv. vitians]
MKSLQSFAQRMLLITAGLALSSAAHAGLSVSGTQLRESNGNALVLRGVNLPHAWYTSRTDAALVAIAATGANSVRVVLSSGYRWNRTPEAEVARIIARCKSLGLIAVLEVHDTTGYGEDGAAAGLAHATAYWTSIRKALIGNEDHVIINIGNEPFGNRLSASEWVNGHATAIAALRKSGLTHALMVDAPNWGQDWQFYMRDNAASLLARDSKRNVIFSVHMYEVFGSDATVNNYLRAFRDKKLTLVIGEFGGDHRGANVDEASIMRRAREYSVGYMGWSWSGNDSSTKSLDIAVGWNAARLSTWGTRLLLGADGIAATSRRASVFGPR